MVARAAVGHRWAARLRRAGQFGAHAADPGDGAVTLPR
jgi:hypothetical protein